MSLIRELGIGYIFGAFFGAVSSLWVSAGIALVALLLRFRWLAIGIVISASIQGILLTQTTAINEYFFDTQGEMSGVVQKSEEHDGYRSYTLDMSKIQDDEFSQAIDEKVLVRADLYPEFFYGDIVKFDGNLEKPESFDGFDYPKYLWRKGIYSILSYAHGKKVGEDHSNLFSLALVTASRTLDDVIKRDYPEPEASLLSGILLGVRNGFDPDFEEALRRTGTTHIIAISGYNITLIIVLIGSLLQNLVPRKAMAPIFGIGITLFVFFVGASASVVRAGLMGFLVVLSGGGGRRVKTADIIILAAFGILIFSPHALFDIGFLLSFLATIGIISVFPLFENTNIVQYFKTFCEQNSKDRGGIKIAKVMLWYTVETFFLTVSAQLTVLPLIIVVFGAFSLISLVVNVLVLFAIPFAMLFGTIGLFLGWIFPILAFIPRGISELLLMYMAWVIEFFSLLNIGYEEENAIPFGLVFFVFWIMFILVFRRKNR